MMNFVLKTRNCVSKTRNLNKNEDFCILVFKTMNFAGFFLLIHLDFVDFLTLLTAVNGDGLSIAGGPMDHRSIDPAPMGPSTSIGGEL